MDIPINIEYPTNTSLVGGSAEDMSNNTVFPNKTTAAIESNLAILFNSSLKYNITGAEIYTELGGSIDNGYDMVLPIKPFSKNDVDIYEYGKIAAEGVDYTIDINTWVVHYNDVSGVPNNNDVIFVVCIRGYGNNAQAV